jgi:hypothetical protein
MDEEIKTYKHLTKEESEEKIKIANQKGEDVFFDYLRDEARYTITSPYNYYSIHKQGGLGNLINYYLNNKWIDPSPDPYEFVLCNGKYTLYLRVDSSFDKADIAFSPGVYKFASEFIDYIKEGKIKIVSTEFSKDKIKETLEKIIKKYEQSLVNPIPDGQPEQAKDSSAPQTQENQTSQSS